MGDVLTIDNRACPSTPWPSVGFGILSRGDGRALDIGLRSLARQDARIDEKVIFRAPNPRQASSVGEFPRVAPLETIDVHWHNARNVALDRLSRHNIVMLAPEGAILDSTALSGLIERFRAAPRLVAAMLVSRRCVPHRRLPPHFMALEPERLTECFARKRSRWSSRYFAPTVIALAPDRGRLPRFETFASRSDWASGRLFLDAAAAVGDVADLETDCFGFFGNAPDRRGGVQQGEHCYESLQRLAAAYPRYRDFVASDIRRLLAEQMLALAFEPDRKATRRFIAGLWSGFTANVALRRRLKRDISHLG